MASCFMQQTVKITKEIEEHMTQIPFKKIRYPIDLRPKTKNHTPHEAYQGDRPP